jgi:hypothetical protein
MKNLIDDLIIQGMIKSSDFVDCKLIDIAGAADEFDASYRRSEPDVIHKTTENVAPPFPWTLFEFRCPEALKDTGIKRIGVFVTAFNPSEESLLLTRKLTTETPKWELLFMILIERQDGICKLPMWIRQWVLPSGKLLLDGLRWVCQWMTAPVDFWPSELDGVPTLPSDGTSDVVQSVVDWLIAPVFFSLSLLHCKNVSLQRVEPVVHSKKHKRKLRKYPPLEHHVIVIRDRKGRIVNSSSLRTGIQQRLHMVRGHFSTYTAQAPLFGKTTGKFWIPAHVTGTNVDGAITSEYKVA